MLQTPRFMWLEVAGRAVSLLRKRLHGESPCAVG